ncbi:gluconokinase [Corynebacterium sp.]|uniref:gluconokinase n=1 Tax=Corynebacterium sp. TaxID=1720 RepID=UPI0026DB20B3|nr:gluconokinase [Corynebacterium sp.]MDO5077006.1 gluconokinase [Corynebacterium sp.]
MNTSGCHIVVMGVSGCGKTSVGRLLAPLLELEYRDGDDMHPRTNIEKMAAGIPLTDEDRWPWLRDIGTWLAAQPEGAVVGCSALRRSYRDLIRSLCPGVAFIHLHGDFDLLLERMNAREGHFMPASLLQSQFDTLEPLGPDERGVVLDVVDSPEALAQQAFRWLSQ